MTPMAGALTGVPSSAPQAPERRGPSAIRTDPLARYILIVAMLGYIALFAYWANKNQDGVGTQAFDLGIFDQGVWLLSKLKDPFITINGRQLFGDHSSFILLPFALVYRVIPSAKVLLFAQTIALGAAAIPVFLIAREKLRSEGYAACLAVVYLIHPVTGWTNLEQFHPDSFEVPLVLFGFWFMLKHRWVGYFACVGLLLLVKEDVALFTFALGVYVALKHNRRVGQVTCLVSAVYFGLIFLVVIPALNEGGSIYGTRLPFGGPEGLLRKTLTHPGAVVAHALTRRRFFYLWQLLAPVAFAAVLAPSVLLIAGAPLFVNFMSGFPYQYDVHYHYSTLILPTIMVATIAGLARVTPELRRHAIVLVTAAAFVFAFLWGPTPLWKSHPFVANTDTPFVASFRAAERLLPEDAVVSAHYAWVPQISHREEVYLFPNPWRAGNWGRFDREGQRLPEAARVKYIFVPPTLGDQDKAVLDSLRAEFQTIFDRDGVLLLKKRRA